MKLKFVIDKKYDKLTAKNLADHWKHSKKDINSIDLLYKKSSNFLMLAQKDYQKCWDKINNKFFKLIEEITGFSCIYPEYVCFVSMVNKGSTNWGKNQFVSVWWRFHPYFMRGVVAGELIISHYFEIIRRNYGDQKLSDIKIWALAEVAAYHMVTLQKDLLKFWPWNVVDVGSHFHPTSYPQFNELKRKLKQPFLRRKDFDEYIHKGIKLIRKYSDNFLWKGKK